MKIGLYSPYLDTLAGGEKYMLTVASCLSEKHDITLFWDKDEESTLKEVIKEKFNLNLARVSFAENIFDSRVSFFSRFQKSREYDAILVLSDGSIPIVGCTLLLHFQTPMPWIQPSLKNSLKLRRVSHVICNSLYTKKYIDKEFGVKSKVIYPPVVIEKKNSAKENIILHVGRFGISNQGSSAKKQEFMAETFKTMIDKGLKNWKLVFVISYKDDAKELVKSFKKSIENYPITLVENPSNETLWQLYNKAKIYWHASGIGEDLQKHPGRAEHFGISTVEAMGCGVVPVVINAGGQPEIVTDQKNGMLWNTCDELMEKTKTVMEDVSVWETLSKEAQTSATRFTVDHFCEQWMQIVL